MNKLDLNQKNVQQNKISAIKILRLYWMLVLTDDGISEEHILNFLLTESYALLCLLL